MTDLLQVLPDFSTQPYSHILPSLEKNQVTTADLLTLDAVDVAKRAQVPVAEARRLTDAVLSALRGQLGLQPDAEGSKKPILASTGQELVGRWSTISTLDDGLDAALAGGIPTGYLIEVTGESGAGKTQFLLTLLLSSQLAPPTGISKSALYISTEAALPTSRLTQLLSTHPRLSSLPDASKPSLSRILSIQTPDLESQDHILRYQLPVAIRRHNIGLVVLDSVAANYRAEFSQDPSARSGAAAMAKRSSQLVQLGSLLRDLARAENIAVVVANQVADRFSPTSVTVSAAVSRTTSLNSNRSNQTTNNNGDANGDRTASPSPQPQLQTEKNNPTSTPCTPAPPPLLSTPDPLTLDHQQRWFTGWGDLVPPSSTDTHRPQMLKTPSLGLVWTNQIACRVALIKEAVYSSTTTSERTGQGGKDGGEVGGPDIKGWRRWMRVVFAPWVGPSEGRGVEFEICGGGVRSLGGGEVEGGEGGMAESDVAAEVLP
ncbi:DNA repair protein rhp57 [Coniosporium apollinis]|uniref:DNA repair protein rhp57 n=1 Tax=Coniosporium apollinis TaxID=61459 RepID=A0ABQ9NXM5_9PEZI|nr:DNA repair protein rhp57 [Coniosporium apollinis]